MHTQDKSLEHGFDPTFLYAWKGMRTQNGQEDRLHEYLEICYIMTGKGRQKIEGEIYEVSEGDLIVINAGTYHQAMLGANNEPVVEFYIGLTDFHLPGLAENTVKLNNGPVFHLQGDLKLKIAKLCMSMVSEKDTHRFGKYYMMKTYAMQILLLLLREMEEPETAENREVRQCSFESVNRKHVVEKIIDYFEDHYAEKISLDQIAENMYLSPFYISRIFKAETGDTPIRYLINIRLEHAWEILKENKELSIQEVAALVGYEDAYHFSKLFKKKFGVSPSGVKKNV